MGYEWLIAALDALAGVEPYEVDQVLAAERRWPVPGVGPGGLPALGIWGRTRAGRPLTVVVRPLGGFDHQILGARDLTPEELAVFEQWEAAS